jgi:small GTP-binding protein
MSDVEHRYRLVVLGSGKVGKSSIIRRLLKDDFVEGYRPTVEDLHCRDYDVGGSTIKVDILDTAGNLEFPAMRRLSISTAHAFLLVYAIDDRESFNEVCQLWEQIREQRSGYQELPCVVAGNKVSS